MRLKTFGGLSIQRDAGPVAGAATQRRRLALLALLAAAGERGLSRDKILGFLWPDSDSERGRGALAQALYALRRDLGAEDLFLGTGEVRLNPVVLPTDLGEFEAAIAAGRYETATSLYEGPFLDGFYLADAPEFERWLDSERSRLAHDYADALERLAQKAERSGDTRGAVTWWRRLAAADPLNSRVCLGLMQALAQGGDRGGAIQHARVYETLLRQELDLDPDPAVLALAERLRAEPATPPTIVAVAAPVGIRDSSPALPAAAEPAPVATEPAPVATADASAAHHGPRLPAWLQPVVIVCLAVAALSVLAVLLVPSAGGSDTGGPNAASAGRAVPVVAVGRFSDLSGGDTARAVRPLSDMLATNLARAPGLQVISTARMLELQQQMGGATADAAGIVRAARQAGATELVDGAAYQLAPGRWRLDLRRTDLASGRVRQAVTVEGPDLFALADRGTRELVANLGLEAPSRSLADVTTRSVVAYGIYSEGLRAYYAGDDTGAQRLFQAALTEDSTFAMAAYYLALASPRRLEYSAAMQRALALSDRASDRERLLIRAQWAREMDDPARLALAESLVVRYPSEPDGELLLGYALTYDGQFMPAVGHFERVLSMDSLSLARQAPRCLACEAYGMAITSYMLADSLPAAERLARAWTKRQPGSAWAWSALETVLAASDRLPEALAAERTRAPLDPAADRTLPMLDIMLRAGDFARADSAIAVWRARTDPIERRSAVWWRTTSLRMQGRLHEALAAAREFRAETPPDANVADAPGAAPYDAIPEAQVLLELGDARAAATLFQAIARSRIAGDTPSRVARQQTWVRTLGAGARAALGDTVGFLALADSLAVSGQRSAYGRDHRLHHHVRGLLFAARGQPALAAGEFRQAIFSPTLGYTRSNLELARTLIAMGHAPEAVGALQAALHGALDASNLYVTRTELHEALGRAWEAAGRRDSAVVHYRWAADAWRRGEPAFQQRSRALDARIATLEH